MRRVLVSLLLTGLIAAACSDDGPDEDQARLRVDGTATVTEPDGDEYTVTDDVTLSFEEVVTLDEGTGTIEFADGSIYELRSDPSPSSVRVGAPPELLAGQVLVTEGFPATLAFDTVTLSASGVLRVDVADERATAYTGRSALAGVGDQDTLVALRTTLLSEAAEPEPLVYDGADPWDRRYLGDAIAFGRRLEALARGYTSELGPSGGRSADFFEAVLPALADEREFNHDLLDEGRAPGETLVGAAIAVQGRQGNFRDRWNEIFSFRDAGAAWGLVALDQGVSSAPVLDSIELAIGRSTTSDPPNTTTTTTTPPTTGDPATTTTTSTTTTTTTTTTPPDDDDGDILDPLLEPGGDAVQELLDSIGLG